MERVSIASPEYIESGDYYKDARDWYCYRFVLPITERSYYFLVSLVSFFAIASMLYTITALFPIEIKLPYLNRIQNFARDRSIIHPIADELETPVQSIAKYLVTRYVKAREEYYPSNEKIQDQFFFVHESSAAPLFKVFQEYLSPQNPDSPLLRYQRQTTRAVDVTDVSFDTNTLHPEMAVVTYEATEITGNQKQKSRWQATISFNLSDPSLTLYGGTPFQFTVTGYETQKLQ